MSVQNAKNGTPEPHRAAQISQAERAIFADIYRFYENNRAASTLVEWEQAASQMAELDNKHNSPLCRNMLLAVWGSIGGEDSKEGRIERASQQGETKTVCGGHAQTAALAPDRS